MLSIRNRAIYFALFVLSNFVCCQSQIVEMNKIISNKNFTCLGGANNCCEAKIRLGELPIDILFKVAKLNKNNFHLSGKVLTETGPVTIFLGYETENKICPIKILKTLNLDEKTFKFNVLITKESVIYFQSLSYEPKIYYVGRLLH